MSNKSEQDELILRYLFGEADEDEANRIEQQILTDNEFFELVLSIESALIDDYVRGRLSEPERSKTEVFLLSSDRRKLEIGFVKTLINDLEKTKSASPENAREQWVERPSGWRSLLVWLGLQNSGKRYSFAVLLLPLIIGLGLIIWNLALQNKLSQIEARQASLEKRSQELEQGLSSQADSSDKVGQQVEEVRNKTDQIEQDVAALYESKPGAPVNETVILALSIESFTRGDGELKVVRIQPGTKWLQISIDAGEDVYKNYNVSIKTFEGRTVWADEDVRATKNNRSRVLLKLPSNLFVSQDYTLSLKAETEDGASVEIGNYHFRVKE